MIVVLVACLDARKDVGMRSLVKRFLVLGATERRVYCRRLFLLGGIGP